MNNLITRSLSGIVYVLLILMSTFYIPQGSFLLAGILGSLALIEWHNFKPEAHKRGHSVFSVLILLMSLAYFSPEISSVSKAAMALVSLVLILMMVLQNIFVEDSQKALDSLFRNVFGLFYIVPALLSLAFLGEHSWVLAGVFIMIWCFDSFAYLVGKYLGSHKLMPRISPNKTWEGFIGGALFSALAAALLWNYSGVEFLKLWHWLSLSFLVVLSATFGDLFESALKRKHNLKDSGKMMPGHGGILDRIDSLLFAMPVTFLFLNLIATNKL